MAENVVDKIGEKNMDLDDAKLLTLKMEEVFHILLKLLENEQYCNEFTGGNAIYSKIITLSLSLALDDPNPQLSFLACFFISRVC
jgi:hypothetical protein